MAVKFTRSSGNVFLDLGFPPAKAEILKLRSDLMIALLKIIRDRGLTQARAAKLFGVTQPRISDLKTAKIERFSIDTLIAMLERAGARVTITVKQPRRAA